MIPTHDCAEYLRQTLESVLAQDPGPETMQIEVVDDHSTRDDPATVVEEVGGGRVGFFRQPENVGHIRNFDTCLQRARGHLVHLLHGDDLVLPGFYATLQRAFEAEPTLGAAFCRDIRMDADGHPRSVSRQLQSSSGVLDAWLETIALGQRLQAPAMVVRRGVYERLGGFDRRISSYGEDWEMWVRIAAHYPVWYEIQPLAQYRLHSEGLTGRSVEQNGSDYRLAIEINREHLPAAHAAAWSRQARENFSLACVRRAYRGLDRGDVAGALAQFKEVLRTRLTPRVVGEIAFRSARLGVRWSRRASQAAFPVRSRHAGKHQIPEMQGRERDMPGAGAPEAGRIGRNSSARTGSHA